MGSAGFTSSTPPGGSGDLVSVPSRALLRLLFFSGSDTVWGSGPRVYLEVQGT